MVLDVFLHLFDVVLHLSSCSSSSSSCSSCSSCFSSSFGSRCSSYFLGLHIHRILISIVLYVFFANEDDCFSAWLHLCAIVPESSNCRISPMGLMLSFKGKSHLEDSVK